MARQRTRRATAALFIRADFAVANVPGPFEIVVLTGAERLR
jgi:hypothetical protein